MHRVAIFSAAASAAVVLWGSAASHADVFDMGAGLTSLEFVNVGDAGNAAHASGHGAVGYEFKISKYEVTNAQYAQFLSAVEPQNVKGLYDPLMQSDPRGGIVRTGSPGHFEGGATEANRYQYAPKPGMENLPVVFITKARAAQFTNWLHNGQPAVAAADGWIVSRDPNITFSGAYEMSAWNSALPARLDGAQYFLPSEDEFVKAAYYQPAGAGGDADGYWDYGTGSNTTPTAALVDANGNVTNAGPDVVNYNLAADWDGQDGNNIAVGTAGGMSYYGAYDMSGNVMEITEDFDAARIVVLGGGWSSADVSMLATRNTDYAQFPNNNVVGFRVAAAVPEPGSVALLGVLMPMCLRRRRA